MIKSYYFLTKPGIIMGNVITTAAGFFLASGGFVDGWLLVQILIGLSFIIASACVFNNYFDREIDKMMARTKNRVLVKGLISGQSAIVFGTILVVLGTIVLSLFTNLMTVLFALLGFVIYVIVYSLGKSLTTYATLIGSIAGAVPPVVGYCGVTNQFDGPALILFLIVVFWQMPHFYAIAIYRLSDYTAASIPVLPVKKGMFVTKVHMLLYSLAFILATIALFPYKGEPYLTISLPLGLTWAALCYTGFQAKNDKTWARDVFRFSLLVITVLCVMIAL